MTEKIDLGDNPFGMFVGQTADEAPPQNEDLLSDLMQLDGTSGSPSTKSSAPVDLREGPKNLWADAVPAPVFAEPEGSAADVAEPAADPAPTSTPSADDESVASATSPTPQATQPQVTPAPRVRAQADDRILEVRPPEPIDQRKLWLLRILLISNLAMMLVMLLLPHPMETRTEYVTGGTSATGDEGATRSGRGSPLPPSGTSRANPDPYVQPPRTQSLGLPNDPNYEKALVQALDGDFVAASATLKAFLAEHPALDPALERLVHAHLAYYLRKSGDLGSAIDHETKARQMAGRAFLPEELLRTARDAELRGDGDAMRRAYAQFLLQEDQLPPALRALVQEAYLKLGDAYRVDAERGDRDAPPTERDGRGSARK